MGGFFGTVCGHDAISDVFFGTDYHSHLGTRRGGMAAYDPSIGLQREIHNIENSPFRTKFEDIFDEMQGTSAIGCISDTDPQPLLIRSNLGTYAICIIGIINNADALIEQYLTFSSGPKEQLRRRHQLRPERHRRHRLHPHPEGGRSDHRRPRSGGTPAGAHWQGGGRVLRVLRVLCL